MFVAISQSEWSASESLRLNDPQISSEITNPVEPIRLANDFAEQVKSALNSQSKERTVASYIEECSDRPEFGRQCFVIAIDSQSIFNQLFNSRSGYRAMYLRSPEEGQKYNSHLIMVILNYLARDESTNASLNGTSAKIWPFFENRLIRDALAIPKFGNSPLGRSLFDPRYPAVVVKGAFLNSKMEEFDPKPDRPEILHNCGYV